MIFNTNFEIIEKIKKINLENDSSYSEIYNLIGQIIIPYHIVSIKRGEYYYRARPKDGAIKSKSDISYIKDSSKIKNFGRANTPNQSLFYAARQTETAIFETSSLIRKNRQDIKTENLILGRWFLKEDINVIAIISNPESIKKNKIIQKLNNQSILNSENELKFILEFFASEFSKKNTGNCNEYKISCAIYNFLQDKLGNSVDGIIFPSVENELNDINIALRPDVVDKSLVLDMIGEYKIDFNYNPRLIIQVGLGDICDFRISEIKF